MNGPNMTSVFAYLRVSGRSQAADGRDGLRRQEEAIRRYAAAHGLSVARVFAERGVSGTAAGDDRPRWVEMLAEIMADGVQTIVVEKLDRLARDLLVQEHIISDLRRRGITLISAAEPDLLQDDPTRKLLRQIVGAIAEYEKTMLVAKLKAARKRIRDRGERCDGAKPYGGHADRPAEAGVLARMREMRAGGYSLEAIAEALNGEGVPSRRGQRWHASAVRLILVRSDQSTSTSGKPTCRD